MFEILSKYLRGKPRKIIVLGENVRNLWTAILYCEEGLHHHVQAEEKHPAIPARDVIGRLLETSGPAGSYFRLISIDEAQAGINRAGFYFPKYFHPSQVLEIYYRAIERHGRNLRVSKEGDFDG
jgi:hypothetical protein